MRTFHLLLAVAVAADVASAVFLQRKLDFISTILGGDGTDPPRNNRRRPKESQPPIKPAPLVEAVRRNLQAIEDTAAGRRTLGATAPLRNALNQIQTPLELPSLGLAPAPGSPLQRKRRRRALGPDIRFPQPPPISAPDGGPVLDSVLEPVLGEAGTVKFVEEQVNQVGARINRRVDFVHETDHGLRMCNLGDQLEQGVCFTRQKCSDLDGTPVGTGQCAAPTPKNTCCKFERTCGEESKETLSYFVSPSGFPSTSQTNNPPGTCEMKVVTKPTTCQVRVDFVDLAMQPSAVTGRCTRQSHLAIINREEKTNTFGKGFSVFCGINTGNHMYIPIKKPEQVVTFRVTETVAAARSFNIKITQIYCRAGIDDMHRLVAPPGCLQYFPSQIGALASFNFDGVSTLAPWQRYSICFRSDARFCSIGLQALAFNLPVSPAPCTPAACNCGGVPTHTFVSVPGASDDNFAPLPPSGCGVQFGVTAGGPNQGLTVTDQKPFVLRVQTGNGAAGNARIAPNLGFLMRYQLNDACP